MLEDTTFTKQQGFVTALAPLWDVHCAEQTVPKVSVSNPVGGNLRSLGLFLEELIFFFLTNSKWALLLLCIRTDLYHSLTFYMLLRICWAIFITVWESTSFMVPLRSKFNSKQYMTFSPLLLFRLFHVTWIFSLQNNFFSHVGFCIFYSWYIPHCVFPSFSALKKFCLPLILCLFACK